MKAHEIFQHMSSATAGEVFLFLQKEEEAVYKAAVGPGEPAQPPQRVH